MRLWRDVATKYGSNLVISEEECCHSAFSENLMEYRIGVSEFDWDFFVEETFWSTIPLIGVRISATCNEYVGSGGRKAKRKD
jgi:hypothetical protein